MLRAWFWGVIMKTVCLTLALAIVAGEAFASGGLSCETEKGETRIELGGGVTRGLGGPLFNFRGSAEVTDAAVADDLKRTSFEQEHVRQYWLDQNELRLGIYREREADKEFGYVELVVMTKSTDEEGTFAGDYVLTVSDMTGQSSEAKTKTFKGELSCFVE